MRASGTHGTSLLAAASVLLIAPVAGCHSYHVDATIENRTGGAIQLLEVDYPSASFGANALAAGADFHYRFDVLGSGPVTIQFTGADGKPVKKTGPTVYERQEGRMEIVLEPHGEVEFHPELTPHT